MIVCISYKYKFKYIKLDKIFEPFLLKEKISKRIKTYGKMYQINANLKKA